MKRSALATCGTMAVLASAAVLAISASGQEPPAGVPADFTVATRSTVADTFFVDNRPRNQPSPGDLAGGTATISGDKSGTFGYTCTLVAARVTLCHGVSTFDDGAIYRMARIAGNPKTLRIAIVGGTGAYEGVHGSITSVRQGRQRVPGTTQDIYHFTD